MCFLIVYCSKERKKLAAEPSIIHQDLPSTYPFSMIISLQKPRIFRFRQIFIFKMFSVFHKKLLSTFPPKKYTGNHVSSNTYLLEKTRIECGSKYNLLEKTRVESGSKFFLFHFESNFIPDILISVLP